MFKKPSLTDLGSGFFRSSLNLGVRIHHSNEFVAKLLLWWAMGNKPWRGVQFPCGRIVFRNEFNGTPPHVTAQAAMIAIQKMSERDLGILGFSSCGGPPRSGYVIVELTDGDPKELHRAAMTLMIERLEAEHAEALAWLQKREHEAILSTV